MTKSSSEKVFLSRNEIYELIWSKPFTTLSKEYNYSDNGLRKICKKHNIPTPRAGHWAKLRHGKSSPMKPLPKGVNIKIELNIRDEGSKSIHSNSQLAKIKNELQNSDLNYIVPDRLSKPHPLVKKAKEVLKNQKMGWYGKGQDIIYSSGECIATEVSRLNIPRALRIWDTLIKLILQRGHEISNEKKSEFLIYDEKFQIRVREILKKVKVNDSSWERYEMVGSGILSVKIEGTYPVKEWRDQNIKTLEEQLLSILAKLELLSEKKKQFKIEREAWHREYEEEQAKKKDREEKVAEELNKFKQLFETATRWHKSQYLRNYIKEFEEYAIQSGSLNEDKQKWIEWAREKANWYDPFVESEVDLLKDINRDKF